MERSGYMRACVYEDRAEDVVAAKLLVASLERHCPDLSVDVTIPGADAPTRAWFARRPAVRLHTAASGARRGYDVKPEVLSRALDDGATEAVWIDADVIAVGDFRRLFAGIAPHAVSVTEEFFGIPDQGGTLRTVGMGLAVGRRLRRTANTALLRVTAAHTALLGEWARWLGSEAYQAAQRMPPGARPRWFLGDQEVLTGLLASDRFAEVPVHWVRRGRDIAHCHHLGGAGYTVYERLRNVMHANTPPLVHTVGERPWRPSGGRPTLHLETSPYTLAAAEYRDVVEEPLPWTDATLPAARALRALCRDGLTTSGLLPALGRELRDLRGPKTVLRRVGGVR